MGIQIVYISNMIIHPSGDNNDTVQNNDNNNSAINMSNIDDNESILYDLSQIVPFNGDLSVKTKHTFIIERDMTQKELSHLCAKMRMDENIKTKICIPVSYSKREKGICIEETMSIEYILGLDEKYNILKQETIVLLFNINQKFKIYRSTKNEYKAIKYQLLEVIKIIKECQLKWLIDNSINISHYKNNNKLSDFF